MQTRYEYSQIRMGVDTRIVVYASSESQALRACQRAYARISELDEKMSDYHHDSELMHLCQQAVGRWVRVSPELFYVLWHAQKLARQTDGAFDITVGPLSVLWRTVRTTQRLPDAQTLQEARARVGWQKVRLDPSRRAVRLETEGTRLDLGGIAKGYACDQALRVLRQHRIPSALIQMGGDLAVSAAPPDRKGWRVEVPLLRNNDNPVFLEMANSALSTSGSSEQFVVIDGTRYAHVVDPRTGIGLRHLVQVSVKARSGILSDSLATALCVMGPTGIDRMRRLYRGIEVWYKEGDNE